MNSRGYFNGHLQIILIFSFFHRPKPTESIREGVSVESLWRHLPLDPGGPEAGTRGLAHQQHGRDADKEEEFYHFSGNQ